jgi:hypothetical protein
MASSGELIATLGPLPADLKKALTNYTNAWVRKLRFGALGASAVGAENFSGALVPFTTADAANGEVAVAHMLGRTPRLAIAMLDLGTVNATLPTLTVTRAADATYVYVSSPTTSAATTLYVE